MKNIFVIILFILTASCGISEDCFKGNGSPTTLTFPYDNFTKIKVYSGVALVVKEGPEYEVKVETRNNIKDDIEVVLQGDMLVVKDNSTCNIARDYGATTAYVTAPNLEEIHSKTEQNIKSNGVLHYPNLKLISIDINDGAGTGDFYLDIESDFIYVESNNVSNFYIYGKTKYFDIFFTWGDGIFYGENFNISQNVNVFHRGTNNIILKADYKVEGEILSLGNLIFKIKPKEVNINTYNKGKIIFDF